MNWFLLLITNVLADKIDTVVVYSDRAEVHRQTTTTCTEGFAQVHFKNLPESVDEKTIRSTTDDNGVVIGVQHPIRTLEKVSNTQLEQLFSDKKQLNENKKIHSDNLQVWSKELQTIESYEVVLMSSIQIELNAYKDQRIKWGNSLKELTFSKRSAQRTINELTQKIEHIQRDIDVIDRQIALLKINPTKNVVDANVLVECVETQNVTTNLFYMVPSARWIPETDVFIVGNNIDLQVSANISQSTGEDWNNSTIILSTTNPNLGSQSLYPAPINIDGSANDEVKVMVERTEDRSSLNDAKNTNGSASHVKLNDGGQSMQLNLPHKTTIKSNGQDHWVPIDEVSCIGNTALISVPRVSPDVFDTISFNNPASYSLIGSVMHLYKNGVLVGNHHHDTIAPGEEIVVSLGTLPHLKVERTTIHDQNDRSILGKKQQLKKAYRISIKNHSNEVENIEIRETFPVSKNEDIKINIDKEGSTGTYSIDEYLGIITWNLELQSNQKVKVDFVYDIVLPSDWQVN